MPTKSRPSSLKREREQKKRERQIRKAARSAEKRERRKEGLTTETPAATLEDVGGAAPPEAQPPIAP
jgi:hypothetical protein